MNFQKLSPEERQKYDRGFINNAFNQYVSDMISIHRSLPSNIDEEYEFSPLFQSFHLVKKFFFLIIVF